ncbi:hypothetical protein [Sphingomonas koreensis]
MKRIATFIAATSALCGAQAANAQIFTPPGGVGVLEGTVSVQKDLGVYTCTLTVTVTNGPNVLTNPPVSDVHGGVTITYPHAHTATATAALSGGFPCGLIAVNNTATVTYDGTNVTLTGFEIVPPLSWGTCTGPITVAWNNGPPATATLSVPLSNSTATAGADCKMAGVLTQISGPALNLSYP